MQSFANRLIKVNRHLSKWAKRENITCFRIYDLDIPEFPFCIERYEHYLHVSEYKTNKKWDTVAYEHWLNECIHIIAEVLQTPIENIYIKERRRLARRSEQYEKVSLESKRITVKENGLLFWVNLTDYLDTGLFLDHRPLRKIFQGEALSKNVLNLFSYTGSFSVYAASGNAQSITNVDLSNTYLNWSQDNFKLNNLFIPEKHHFVQSDIMTFLKQPVSQLYDLVFVDPPAFSNSKKISGTWDTQRDHAAMLHYLFQHVQPGGTVYFSNNLRSFSPDFKRLENIHITDISLKTIPEDFRNKKIHYCYKMEKG